MHAPQHLRKTDLKWSLQQDDKFDSDSRVTEGTCPSLNFVSERLHCLIALKTQLEIFQLLSLLFLNLECDLATTIQEEGNLLEIRPSATTRGHGSGTKTNTAWGQSWRITVDRFAVQRDRADVTQLLDFRPCQAVGPHIPQDQVVVSPITGKLVALLYECLA